MLLMVTTILSHRLSWPPRLSIGRRELRRDRSSPSSFLQPTCLPKIPIQPSIGRQATPIGGSDYYYYKNKMPYVQEWELSLQRQLGTATVLSVNYVGTVGRQLLTFEESNPGNQALCLQLNNPANVAPGTATCGPLGEDSVYTTASGQTVNGTRPPSGLISTAIRT